MNRVKQALRRWLGVTALEDENAQLKRKLASAFKTIEQANIRHTASTKYFDGRIAKLQDLGRKAEELNATCRLILKNFGVAADVNIHDDSWAVFAVGGKKPRVYFVDLRGASIQEIDDIVKRFNSTRRAVDTPYGMDLPTKRIVF